MAFNLGFYMVLPYLATHMSQDLGLQAASIGLVLGLRVFSQQGLFLLGGWLGDVYGYRRTIIVGCAVRTVGFVLLGATHNLLGLLLGAALTGLAGALFTPTAQAYLSRLYHDNAARQQAFTWHNWMSEAGMLLGPLVGLWAGSLGFGVAALGASALFGALTLLQWRVLPPDTQTLHHPDNAILPHLPERTLWRQLLGHKAFWVFSLLAAGYSVLFQQLYLAVPAFLHAHQANATMVTTVFTQTALLSIVLQWPIAKWAAPRMGTPNAMGWGLACMGLAFLSLLNPLALNLPTMISVMALLFSLGSVLIYPLLSNHVAHYAPAQARARYYGFFAAVGGIASLLANVLIGYALDSNHALPQPSLWWVLGVGAVLAGWALRHHVALCLQSQAHA
nr:MFS transporter [Curvibacter sp. CHRR-16]